MTLTPLYTLCSISLKNEVCFKEDKVLRVEGFLVFFYVLLSMFEASNEKENSRIKTKRGKLEGCF